MGNPPAHKARKRFGQNFLHDNGIIDRIVSVINPQPDENLVEIGPGLGALTRPLLSKCDSMTVIELDRDLVARLERLSSNNSLRIISADALKYDFFSLAEENQLRVVGNLPYNISTPLLFHLLSYRQVLSDMHFMLQLEVVRRLAAQPGSKEYGRLSVMFQAYCDVEHLFDVPATAFNPQPKVVSAVVRVKPATPCIAESESPELFYHQLERVVQQAFGTRRKTLRNNFKGDISESQLIDAGIDPSRRAETLTVEHYVNLTRATLTTNG